MSSEQKIEFIPVLAEPEKARNVGFVARAMKCTGLSNLRIVHRKWKETPDGAFVTGVSAVGILRKTQFYSSVAEAIADCDGAIAMSRRDLSDIPKCEMHQLKEKISSGSLASAKKIAVLFGRESAGLRIDEANMCQILCFIQTEGTMSFNLGQAASVAFYHLQDLKRIERSEELPAALFEEKEAFKNFILENLSDNRLAKSDVPQFLDSLLRDWDPNSPTLRSFFGLLRDLKDGK